MRRGYAVFAEGDEQPGAVFAALEDARAFGALCFGAGAFRTEEIFTEAIVPAVNPARNVPL
jgi:hypothetical protein